MSMKLGRRTWGVGGGVPRRGAEEKRVVAARAPSGRRPGRMGAEESGALAAGGRFPPRNVGCWRAEDPLPLPQVAFPQQPAGYDCHRSHFLSSAAHRWAKNAWRGRCACREGHRALGDPGARARRAPRWTRGCLERPVLARAAAGACLGIPVPARIRGVVTGTGTGEIKHLVPKSVRAPAGLSAGCVTGVRVPARLSAPGAGICRTRAPTSQSARFREPARRWLSSARVPIKWPALLAIL